MIRAAFAALLMLLALPLQAATLDEINRLWTARQMDRELALTTESMAAYLTSLDDEMLLGQGGPDWQARGRVIFAPERIEADLRAALATSLSTADVEALVAMGEHPLGQRWADAFLAALADLKDPADLKAAVAELAEGGADDPQVVEMMRGWLERDAYIDQMVAANLNYYTAFLRTALAGGAFGPPPSDAMLLDLVHAGAEGHRERTFLETLALSVRAARSFTPDELNELLGIKTAQPIDVAYKNLFAGYESAFIPLYAELGRELSRFALENEL